MAAAALLRPPLAFRKRERLEAYIDALIGLLDQLDGDTDREPDDDGEPDADGEPYLGAAEPTVILYAPGYLPQARSGSEPFRDERTSQAVWCRGGLDDREWDPADEGDVQAELLCVPAP